MITQFNMINVFEIITTELGLIRTNLDNLTVPLISEYLGIELEGEIGLKTNDIIWWNVLEPVRNNIHVE